MMGERDQTVDLRAASTDDLRDMGLPANFTMEDLKTFLSPAEIERLNDGEDPLFDTSAAAAEAEEEAGDGADAGTADDEHDDEGDGDDAGDEAGDEDSDQNDHTGGEADDAGTVDQNEQQGGEAAQEAAGPAFVAIEADANEPVIRQIDVSAAKAVVDSAAAERKALRQKFDDGEISEDEFDTQLDALTDKVADARAEIKIAQRTNEDQTKAYQSAWYDKTGTFMKANPAFADNEPVAALGGHSKMQVFDAALRRITSDPGLNSLSMAEKINRAADMASGFFKQETGQDITPRVAPVKQAKEAAPPPNKGKTTAPAKSDKAARPNPGPKPEPLRTLGGISTATDMETDSSKFAALDRSKGVELEVEFSRMSKADQEAYLRGM